jgi:hypothetical protein
MFPFPKSDLQTTFCPVLVSSVPVPLVRVNDNGQWLNIGNEADAVTGARAVIAVIAASARTTVPIRLKVMVLLEWLCRL